MSQTIIIRRAALTDMEVLLQCEQGIIQAERPFTPVIKEDPVHYYDLKKMLTDSQIDVVVAEQAEAIVGCGYARIEVSKPYYKHQQHAYLGMMYVRPEYRGQGVNALIIEKLKTLVRERGLTEMRLEVYAQNSAAIKAYEKVGFQAHMLEMRMSLE